MLNKTMSAKLLADTEGPSPRTCLYRFYAANDVLVYVGISKNPAVRWSQHADKAWRPVVARREWVWYPSRAKAEAAERQTIEAERPLFNLTYNSDGAFWNRVFAGPGVLTQRRVLAFARAARLDPRIQDLLNEVLLMHRVDACPDCQWPGIKNRAGEFVGFHAPDPADPWLTGSEAYEAVIATLYEALPLVACLPCGAD